MGGADRSNHSRSSPFVAGSFHRRRKCQREPRPTDLRSLRFQWRERLLAGCSERSSRGGLFMARGLSGKVAAWVSAGLPGGWADRERLKTEVFRRTRSWGRAWPVLKLVAPRVSVAASACLFSASMNLAVGKLAAATTYAASDVNHSPVTTLRGKHSFVSEIEDARGMVAGRTRQWGPELDFTFKKKETGPVISNCVRNTRNVTLFGFINFSTLLITRLTFRR